MIAIIDYGMGNLQSISNAFEALGEETIIASKPFELCSAKAIVLPGVGAFRDGMRNLRRSGFVETLNKEIIEKKKPYLGICLGMQFLAEKSLEHGIHQGLGWIKGTVKKLEPNDSRFKIPHMGWNNIEVADKSILFEGLKDDPVFYFVHSYHLDINEDEAISSFCWHGQKIIASIQKENIFGVQFHPEKSQTAGIKLLKNFIELVGRREDDA